MPKTNLCGKNNDDEFIQNVAANIHHELFLQHLSIQDLSKKTGIPQSTLTQHIREPGSLRQIEVVAIAKALKVSPFRLVSSKLTYEEVQQ